jgi:hypothetical protein
MRLPARTLFVLLPILASCGSVQIILKPPIENRCGTTGLKGCPELTDGVLLYVQGDKVKGKEALLKAAAQNEPAKVKQFAQALKELDKIPGTGAYMKQVMEIVDILASAPGAAPGGQGGGQVVAQAGVHKRRRRHNGPPPVDIETRFAAGDVPGEQDGGMVAPAINSDRGSCGGVPGYAFCVWAATGPLVVTQLAVNPACPVEMVAGAAKTAQNIDAPRWVARQPRGATRVFVRDGESLFIGVQTPLNDPSCALSWTGVYPD